MIGALIMSAFIAYGGNPWAMNDWEPLREKYSECTLTEPTSLHRYVCMERWYHVAVEGIVTA